MDSLLSPDRDSCKVDVSSLISLLEKGVHAISGELSTEGLSLLAQVREQLFSHQPYLAAALDACMQEHATYQQALQALHEACRHFVKTDAAWQTHLASLEKQLLTLKDEGQDLTQLSIQPLAESPGLPKKECQSSRSPSSIAQEGILPSLHITCFGHFEVSRLGQPLDLCSNRNGQVILRYLVAQSDHRALTDVLMTELWPDDEPKVALHKLQVAVSALRRSLNNHYPCDPGGGYILCKQRVYYLNPAISFHIDVEEFIMLYRAGKCENGTKAMALYEQACQLYTGPFLSEDLYVDWSALRREQLSQIYLVMCGALSDHYLEVHRYEDAVLWATAMLKENRFEENAYRQLMRAYIAQGRQSEALRQYHRCQQLLSEELGVEPMPETVKLFQEMLIQTGAQN